MNSHQYISKLISSRDDAMNCLVRANSRIMRSVEACVNKSACAFISRDPQVNPTSPHLFIACTLPNVHLPGHQLTTVSHLRLHRRFPPTSLPDLINSQIVPIKAAMRYKGALKQPPLHITCRLQQKDSLSQLSLLPYRAFVAPIINRHKYCRELGVHAIGNISHSYKLF